MALGAVTELELFTAVKDCLLAAEGWFATPGLFFHFGRRAPNADDTPYVVIAIEEQEDPDVESDGAAAQQFLVEILAVASGPLDAEAANTAMTALSPAWNSTDTGLTLTDTDKTVCAVYRKSGRLRLLERLKAGSDQYSVALRWRVDTAALIGAQ